MADLKPPLQVAVVGAGYAGMAAAVALAEGGTRVTVFEASQTLGGRARRVSIQGLPLDNGAHILIGAYRETLALMARVGVEASTALLRHPLHLEMAGALRLTAPAFLPAPLHLAWALLFAQGLNLSEKWAALRLMQALKRSGFRVGQDVPVADFLTARGQPPRLVRLFWEPLCLAALNTPVAKASAQVFAHVLRDTLAGPRAASDLLLPRTDLSALLPDAAADYLRARGGRVLTGHRVQLLEKTDDGYRVDGEAVDGVILATAPYHLGPLLAALPGTASLAALVDTLEWQPIVTVYLAYDDPVALPFAMTGISGGTAQWFFDRQALAGDAHLVAAVISGEGPHEALSAAALADRVEDDLRGLIPALPRRRWHQVITEKRATFACTPQLRRPGMETGLPGLLLAGDHVAGDYPATLEGAVRSGLAAAQHLMHQASGRQL